MAAFLAWLAGADCIILAGANGSELERRGFVTRLPLWTADAAMRAPELLRAVHDDFLGAGADVIVANTFRTAPYVLRRAGREEEAATLTAESVRIARAACAGAGHGFVAGDIGPLEDCFRPERVPPDAVLELEHARHAQALAAAGVDLLLVETIATVREARIATHAALATGLPVWVSLMPAPQGRGDLLGGDDLDVARTQLEALEVAGRRAGAILVNCAPPAVTQAALARGRGAATLAGALPNLGTYSDAGWLPRGVTAAEFAAWGRQVTRDMPAGVPRARIVGGCCGTTPAHIAALVAAVRPTRP
jgi:S-methylmethionine-dependent homocysteine/selenocysteine methylase